MATDQLARCPPICEQWSRSTAHAQPDVIIANSLSLILTLQYSLWFSVVAAVDRRDRRTDGRTFDRHLDPVPRLAIASLYSSIEEFFHSGINRRSRNTEKCF